MANYFNFKFRRWNLKANYALNTTLVLWSSLLVLEWLRLEYSKKFFHLEGFNVLIATITLFFKLQPLHGQTDVFVFSVRTIQHIQNNIKWCNNISPNCLLMSWSRSPECHFHWLWFWGNNNTEPIHWKFSGPVSVWNLPMSYRTQ